MYVRSYTRARANALAKVAGGEFNNSNGREGTSKVTVVPVTSGYTRKPYHWLDDEELQRNAHSPEVKVTSSLIWSRKSSSVVKRQHNIASRNLRFNHQQYWFNDSDENEITFSGSLSQRTLHYQVSNKIKFMITKKNV